ncbi:family 16 glycoside hydrolase [Sunxiuqinia sp. A32]|uniref:family 16 glycoside hydrolase n=1 Tax=Sunxiuqinia sp. A32 TaxID=3461496 RepID=UPI0040464AA4
MKNYSAIIGLIFLYLLSISCSKSKDGEWIDLFNGTDLTGWEANENPESFKVVDGAIYCDGPRAHLFYKGDYKNGVFKNFEFKTMVKTLPSSNSGVVFHTQEQPYGPLLRGYEVQIDNSYEREGDFQELKKTGSIYGVRNVYFPTHNDNEWFELSFKVVENHVEVFVNNRKVNDYVQPDDPWRIKNDKMKVFSRGLLALQCHDEGSKVYFKDIKIKVLPDGEKLTPPTSKEWDTKITQLHHANFPVIDFHVHLKGGLTIEQAIENSMKLGINYGIAPNCGLHFPVTNDESLFAYMDTVKAQPIFRGMQAEGREWVTLFSPEAIAKFDYVFTDAMTWTDRDGHRMRLWIPEEVFVKNEQDFMEQLVGKIENILSKEPVDIHVNPTYLPEVLAAKYDELWTDERIDRFVNVLAKNKVALEINSRLKLPSEKILKKAKEAGVKFTFGTNNTTSDLGTLDYSLEMMKKLGLTYKDMFMPKPNGSKPVQTKGLPDQITG